MRWDRLECGDRQWWRGWTARHGHLQGVETCREMGTVRHARRMWLGGHVSWHVQTVWHVGNERHVWHVHSSTAPRSFRWGLLVLALLLDVTNGMLLF